MSRGVNGGFPEGGAESNGCEKTKHSFLRVSKTVRDVEAELPFGQMETALTMVPVSPCDGGTRGGEPGRTQHPLIRVDIGWGGRVPQPVVIGSWGTQGGNGGGGEPEAAGVGGVGREAWELSIQRPPTPNFLCPAVKPWGCLLPPASHLWYFHPQQVASFSPFLSLPMLRHTHLPLPPLPPSLLLSSQERLLPFLNFFLSSQLTKFSIRKSDKPSL